MIVILLIISAIDIRRKRIPNWSLAVILVIKLFEGLPHHNFSIFPILVIGNWFCYRFLTIGAGDLKLISILLLFAMDIGSFDSFFTGLIVGALVLTVLSVIRHRSLSAHIPFAPAITAGFFATVM